MKFELVQIRIVRLLRYSENGTVVVQSTKIQPLQNLATHPYVPWDSGWTSTVLACGRWLLVSKPSKGAKAFTHLSGLRYFIILLRFYASLRCGNPHTSFIALALVSNLIRILVPIYLARKPHRGGLCALSRDLLIAICPSGKDDFSTSSNCTERFDCRRLVFQTLKLLAFLAVWRLFLLHIYADLLQGCGIFAIWRCFGPERGLGVVIFTDIVGSARHECFLSPWGQGIGRRTSNIGFTRHGVYFNRPADV